MNERSQYVGGNDASKQFILWHMHASLQNWKGVWRWYDEAMLECCTSLNSYQDDGMSFDDYGDLSRYCRCNLVVFFC